MNKPDRVILDKIEKLLNIAREGSGAPDPERATAKKLADAMMLKYGLEVNQEKYTAGDIELIAVPEAKPAQVEALKRALSSISFFNYSAIVHGFAWKGIEHTEVIPRENVFTYNAWLALGRQVQKGEKGVKVFTMIVKEDKETGRTKKYPGSTTVFHITQTKGTKPEYTGILQHA